ncbi:MAG: potassium/proton antiporter [Candidatus Omnitrophota bacterium]
MYYPVEELILVVSILLILSIIVGKVASKFALPAILIFIAVGMAAGSEGLGGIYFDDPRVAQIVGTFALVIIIFTGGVQTEWKNIRDVFWEGAALSIFGVLFTALIVGWATFVIFHVPLINGLILGAIVSSTDASAVFSVMRAKNMHFKGKLPALLEFESGSNDPMAVFLTMGLIHLAKNPSAPVVTLLLIFIRQLFLGVVMGYVSGKVIVFVIHRLRLEHEGLYPILTLALVLLTYGVTATLGGSGFLAVYVAGIIVAESQFVRKKNIIEFHDGFSWLMQIAMFMLLGLLVFPSKLVPVIGPGLLIASLLIFVARPAGVFATLVFSKLNVREKAMVSWVGLRGAVPIILVTFLLIAGVPEAEELFNIVFCIVFVSILIQGPSIISVARRLGVLN